MRAARHADAGHKLAVEATNARTDRKVFHRAAFELPAERRIDGVGYNAATRNINTCERRTNQVDVSVINDGRMPNTVCRCHAATPDTTTTSL